MVYQCLQHALDLGGPWGELGGGGMGAHWGIGGGAWILAPPRTVPQGVPLLGRLNNMGGVLIGNNNSKQLGGKKYRALQQCPTFRGSQYQVFARIKHAYEIYLVLTERGISDPVGCMHQFLLEKKLGEKLYRLKKEKLSLEEIATLMTNALVSF